MGAESWRVEHTLEYAPPNSETVRVIGQQWFWSFEHADGTQEINELHLKTDVPYRFELIANDVLHDFAVPDFALLMDAVPGRVNTMWNVFDKPGEYLIECREYCGQGHQDMRAKLFVEQNNGTTSVPSNPEKPLISGGTGFATVISPLKVVVARHQKAPDMKHWLNRAHPHKTPRHHLQQIPPMQLAHPMRQVQVALQLH